jgi:hypothetical protein
LVPMTVLSQWIHAVTDRHLLIVSTAFIILTVAVYILKEFICPLVHHYRLRNPIDLFFVITSIDRHKVDYAIQDEKEHRTKDLILPSNSKIYLHLVFKNKIAFTQNHFTLYFDGNSTKNPTIQEYYVPFIKEGVKTKSPYTDQSHYIDYHGAYHIDETKHRAKDDYSVYSFNATTRDAGTYQLILELSADGVSSRQSLVVYVQHRPQNKMRCRDHWGCFISPDPSAWVMYGRRPRCKRNLTISEAFGCGHVFGL